MSVDVFSVLKLLLGHVLKRPEPSPLFLLSPRLRQAFRDQMWRLLSGHLSQRPSPESQEQSVPPQLLHLHDVQQTAIHWGGALHHRREQIRLQRRLPEQRQCEGRQPALRYGDCPVCLGVCEHFLFRCLI